MPVDRRAAVTDRLATRILQQTAFGHRLASSVNALRHRAAPTHWSNLFSVVTLACVAVLFLSGIYLMFFYTPSSETVEYAGPFVPLQGLDMSKALESTLYISFELRAGLLIRQAHHWAGLLLPASIIMQLLTIFFTGAFRRPRRGSWVLLFLIFVTALACGWSGYALPDDMLSGTGLRITEGIALAIPIIGPWISGLLFGGPYPSEIIGHLYPIHVAITPALLVMFLVARGWVAYTQRPPQFAGPGRTPGNVVGVPVLPTGAARAGGLFLAVCGLILLIAATVTVNPIWLYGPSAPGDASAGSQPDWYTGFLDGALRLVPPGWEFVWLDRTWTLAILAPLAVVTTYLTLVLVYPFIEGWASGDQREHHLLDRPRNAPTRTAIGASAIVFYGVLWGAGSSDLITTHFHLPLEAVVTSFQAAALFAPTLAFLVTRQVCRALQAKDHELVLHGRETGRIVRLPGGEYVDIHAPLDDYERWRLIDTPDHVALQLRPNEAGRLTGTRRLQWQLSRLLFEDRITMRRSTACLSKSDSSQHP